MQLKKGIYRHYKGQYYRVLFAATHSETEEKMVVYQQMYGDEAIWVRPLGMFEEIIEKDNVQMKRFEFVKNE